MAIFVSTNQFNCSRNPESVRTGRLVKSLRNSWGFYFGGKAMENQKRQFFSQREIEEIRRQEWQVIYKVLFLSVVFVVLIESGSIIEAFKLLIG